MKSHPDYQSMCAKTGVFGETPLHQAVLFARKAPGEDYRILKGLWRDHPDLRTAQYKEPLYRGENVLHIALVRKLPKDLINFFLEENDQTARMLLNQRADGEFFVDDTCETKKELNFGETPLAFAASTNQRDMFDLLLQRAGKLSPKIDKDLLKHTTKKEHGGYSLLHLMVLHSTENRTSHEASSQETERPAAPENGKDDRSSELPWYCKMYDHIEEAMKKHSDKEWGTVYEKMRHTTDAHGYIPLSLAAARGSLRMFNHLMEKSMEVEWTYGPVTCKRLLLEGVDIPLDKQQEPKMRVDKSDGQHLSVLEVVVNNNRLDILSHGTCPQILDKKWDKYAKRKFRRNFYWSICFSALLVVVTVWDPHDPWQPVPSWLIMILEIWFCLFYCQTFSRAAWSGTASLRSEGYRTYLWETNEAHLFERVYALCSTPICVLAMICRARRCLAGRQAGPDELVQAQSCRQPDGSWLHTVESILLLVQSILCFMALFRGMMGFAKYGHFVLMLKNMIQQDMRKFFIIYLVCLLFFSHVLNIIRDSHNTGWKNLLESVLCIFSAALDQIELPQDFDTSAGENTGALVRSWLVYSIIICNFFLVSLVLINLLIAMMSSTYDSINRQAKSGWNHCRASIITNLDKVSPLRSVAGACMPA